MLENLKIKLIKIAKDAEKYNLCKERTGNFSIRDESTGYIIITPSKIKRENLKEEHICVVDLSGKEIEVLEGIRPSSELLLHLEIYKARKDIRSIMHIHSMYATTFSVANKVIPPIIYDSANYGGYIYVANYEKTKTIELAKDVLEQLNKGDACLLERDGVVVVSKNIDDVLLKARYVEEVAEVYYKTLMLNQLKEPTRLTRKELMLQ
ncbi:class II aldolase [Clostridium beijerinckii]|nr:class II aldolase [Clostridium beijerinckii]